MILWRNQNSLIYIILTETRNSTLVKIKFKSKTKPNFSKRHKLLCHGNVLFETDIQKKIQLKWRVTMVIKYHCLLLVTRYMKIESKLLLLLIIIIEKNMFEVRRGIFEAYTYHSFFFYFKIHFHNSHLYGYNQSHNTHYYVLLSDCFILLKKKIDLSTVLFFFLIIKIVL